MGKTKEIEEKVTEKKISKKTQEKKKTKTEIVENKIIEFISKKDAYEFKQMATGRKFCKIGSRMIDICSEEIERYKYNNSNFLVKLFKHKKFKTTNMIETRVCSHIRSIAARSLIENEELVEDVKDLMDKVKNIVLKEIEKYEKEVA